MWLLKHFCSRILTFICYYSCCHWKKPAESHRDKHEHTRLSMWPGWLLSVATTIANWVIPVSLLIFLQKFQLKIYPHILLKNRPMLILVLSEGIHWHANVMHQLNGRIACFSTRGKSAIWVWQIDCYFIIVNFS